MNVLVIAELASNRLVTPATASAVAAGRVLGDVTVLVAGHDVGPASADAARLEGVTRVLCADHPAFEHGMAEPLADLIVKCADGYGHVVAVASMQSRNVLPRAAALLDVMVIPDVVTIVDGETFERPIYAGNALQTVRSSDRIKIVSIRQSRFDPAGEGAPAPIETVQWAGTPPLSALVENRLSASDRPDLAAARIVVAGGRGLGSAESFAILDRLAEKLGAAVGASRAAVDAGYAPNDWQVGQTGKIVAPDLYIAIGISGAIQHLAGMKESGTIIAINTDPDAPIFKVADYGLVGDFAAVLPALLDRL